MGREIRMVPFKWEHPKEEDTGEYIPLFDGYKNTLEDFKAAIEENGLAEALDYFGGGPVSENYMLIDCDDTERTHYMMYETTSEGTPISPAFETPEALAHWLADNGASANGKATATYEEWLLVCIEGWAPSMMGIPGFGLLPGVVAMSKIKPQ